MSYRGRFFLNNSLIEHDVWYKEKDQWYWYVTSTGQATFYSPRSCEVFVNPRFNEIKADRPLLPIRP